MGDSHLNSEVQRSFKFLLPRSRSLHSAVMFILDHNFLGPEMKHCRGTEAEIFSCKSRRRCSVRASVSKLMHTLASSFLNITLCSSQNLSFVSTTFCTRPGICFSSPYFGRERFWRTKPSQCGWTTTPLEQKKRHQRLQRKHRLTTVESFTHPERCHTPPRLGSIGFTMGPLQCQPEVQHALSRNTAEMTTLR